jgi:predicted transcriptional regulator
MDESLNRAALANGAPPPAVAANGHDPALIAEAKRLVETTTISQTRIGATLGLTSQAISNLSRAGGWQRPAGAPQAPRLSRASRSAAMRTDAAAARRERLVMRFYRACERQLALVERKLRRPRAEMEEKDVRALGLLAKTLGTLMALDRDDGAKLKDAEPVDRDKLNAELARRIARWAEGREEPE